MRGVDLGTILSLSTTIILAVMGVLYKRSIKKRDKEEEERKEIEKERRFYERETNKNLIDLTYEVKRANEKLDNQTIKNEQIYKNKEDIIELNKRVDYLEEKR